MVKVYLPMGYPVQQGAEFETVVYQNNLVRSYTLPKDPRSDSMMFHRRFLSDVSKMRSYLGEVGRSGLIEALGRTWATVLFQLIKSDSFSWWSDAQEEWDSFDEVDQQEWRDAAPYEVTFNDKGWIFFGLNRVIFKALEYYAKGVWRCELWGSDEAAGALTWYLLDRGDVWSAGEVLYNQTAVKYYGEWENGIYGTAPNQGTQKHSSGESSDFAELLGFGKEYYFTAKKVSGLGAGEVFIDGAKIGDVDFNGATGDATAYYSFTKKRVRSVVVKPVGSVVIAVRVFNVSGA